MTARCGKKSILLAALCGTALTGLGAQAASAPQKNYAIVGATVFDATGAAPKLETVLIHAGRIVNVGPGLSVPGGYTRIDAKGEALVPGFYDLHTHWTAGGEPAVTPAIANADIAAGVTTVADFNAAPESFAPRRAWLAALAAPHVKLCARLSTPGGHGADWADAATTKMITTPEGARDAIDQLVLYKPDCFGEVMTDGWRYGVTPDDTSMNEDALTALVDEAHKNHLPVLTHTLRIAKGAEAGRAKVDVIDHALQDRDIDDETIQAIKQGGSFYAPTLAVYEFNKPGRRMSFAPTDPRYIQGKHKWEIALNNVKKIYDAGVPIALGTDSGMPGTPHGVSTLREMELLVQAGLTPTAALIAGTANSAKAVYESDDRGTIEKGKRADLVLLKGKPWENIKDVEATDRVFIDGALVFGPGAPPLNPVTPPPAVAVAALVDDFERPDLRTNLDTLTVTEPDGGIDRTSEIIDQVPRGDSGHALGMMARMAVKKDPQAAVVIPLTRGSIAPADVRKYRGIKLDIRGDGPYVVALNTLDGEWTTTISGASQWQTVTVPFTDLKRAKGGRPQFKVDGWTGDNVTEIEIKAIRKGGEKTWMNLDNVSFY
jgi:imidazolonepropionase-like amidohydrolase